MKLSSRTIETLVQFILGEHPGLKYKKGREIVKFFNHCLSEEEVYGNGFPTRSEYVESRLKRLNGSDMLLKVVEQALCPTYCDGYLPDSVFYFNQFLTVDGYVAEIVTNQYRTFITVSSLDSESVNFPNKMIISEFIKEQVEKCTSKIRQNDLDGAITNARSLVEAVIEEILKNLGDEPKRNGKLPALYKQLRDSLNLHPKQEMHKCFTQIASGLISCIDGVAQISNTTSDRHSRMYKSLKHHAQLAIDTAFTICKFLLGVFENNKNKPFS